MSYNTNYITLRGFLVSSTDLAHCFAEHDKPAEPETHWIPKSQTKSLLKFAQTGHVWTPCEITITEWIAAQKGLCDLPEVD